ncbi:MAG TPA: hypothetical protein VI937_03235 [Negativicutes bacterium]|nr:hypothetical protein [Negativicutes bacterium]
MDATQNGVVRPPRHAEQSGEVEKDLAETMEAERMAEQAEQAVEAMRQEKEELQQREAAKDAMSMEHHEKMMAILKETNEINKRIIQRLLAIIAKLQGKAPAAVATPPASQPVPLAAPVK